MAKIKLLITNNLLCEKLAAACRNSVKKLRFSVGKLQLHGKFLLCLLFNLRRHCQARLLVGPNKTAGHQWGETGNYTVSQKTSYFVIVYVFTKY